MLKNLIDGAMSSFKNVRIFKVNLYKCQLGELEMYMVTVER